MEKTKNDPEIKPVLLTPNQYVLLCTLYYQFPDQTAPSFIAVARRAEEILQRIGFSYGLRSLHRTMRRRIKRFFRSTKLPSRYVVRLTEEGAGIVTGKIPYKIQNLHGSASHPGVEVFMVKEDEAPESHAR